VPYPGGRVIRLVGAISLTVSGPPHLIPRTAERVSLSATAGIGPGIKGSGKLPVDGRCALLFQKLVGAAERAGAEEAPVGGVRAGVGRFD
jgi:hypothetical protein